MQKRILAFTLAILCNNALAINNTNYYCPDSVECSEMNNINSCKVVWSDKNPNHWQIENISSPSSAQAGTYNFEKVQSPYDPISSYTSSTSCSYGFKVNSKITKYIYLYGEQLQAISSEDVNNKWTMKASENDGVVANCYSNDTLNCPLTIK